MNEKEPLIALRIYCNIVVSFKKKSKLNRFCSIHCIQLMICALTKMSKFHNPLSEVLVLASWLPLFQFQLPRL